jgi:DinB superfamily
MHVDQLRDFLGLPPSPDSPEYQRYVDALERVLAGVEEAVRQVPGVDLHRPTPNRGRDLAELVFNIHDPIALMGASLDSGRFEWRTENDYERSRRFGSTNELASFCREVRDTWATRIRAVDSERALQTVETPKGRLTNEQVLQAQAFHAAQHLRQIYVFLRELGIEPRRELGAEDIEPIKLGDIVF